MADRRGFLGALAALFGCLATRAVAQHQWHVEPTHRWRWASWEEAGASFDACKRLDWYGRLFIREMNGTAQYGAAIHDGAFALHLDAIGALAEVEARATRHEKQDDDWRKSRDAMKGCV